MRLTYADIKNEVGLPVSLCGTHPDLLPYVNEACQILWNEGDWPGKYIKYRVRVSNLCDKTRAIVWPRQLETIEAMNQDCQPIGIRDMWFEFIENSTGSLENYMRRNISADMQECCLFEEVPTGGNEKIKVYCDKAEIVGATILLLGYDDNNQWIRTQDINGVWQDGEYVVLNNITPSVTVNVFSKVTGVQKPLTNGYVRLYSFNTVTLIELPLAVYDYDETIPVYRKTRLTGAIANNCQCVTVMGRRRFIPIAKDTDYVYPPHMPAIKTMIIALVKRDNAQWQEYTVAGTQAKYLLSKMNQQYRGNGAVRGIRFINSHAWGSSGNIQ